MNKCEVKMESVIGLNVISNYNITLNFHGRKILFEEYILSPGGILNMFTTEIIVLENFENRNYKVYEVDDNQNKVEVFDECSFHNKSRLEIEWIK